MKAKSVFWILIGLLMMSLGFAAYGSVPEKPYGALADGDTLTDVIYNGMNNVIYAWAQATNASVTQLMSGAGISGTLTASRTATVASASMPLVWNSISATHLPVNGSGTMNFIVFAQATGLDGNNFATFSGEGAMYANGTASALMGDFVFLHRTFGATSTAWNLVASVTSPGFLSFEASTTASVTWTLDMIKFEGHYPH